MRYRSRASTIDATRCVTRRAWLEREATEVGFLVLIPARLMDAYLRSPVSPPEREALRAAKHLKSGAAHFGLPDA